jgi:hypothetical protein
LTFEGKNMRMLLVCLLLTLVPLVGCSSGNPTPPAGVIVKGKIVQGGMPLKVERLPPGEVPAEVVFVPEGGGEVERQPLQPDGTFRETGWEKGIKPGKYKLAVYHYVQGRGSDGLSGAFSEKNTPITVDVPESKVGGELDLGTIELNDQKK